MPRSRRTVLAVLLTLTLAGCAHRPGATQPTPRSTAPPETSWAQRAQLTTVPVTPPSIAGPRPVRPDVRAATRTPLAVARAWAIAAYSGSWHDPAPGTWTARTGGLVTGAEAAAERVAASGGGGVTWTQITTGRCVTTLRQLAAVLPSDAPAGTAVRVVYLSATQALTCDDGTVHLVLVAAQLIIDRVDGRWLVARVTH